VILSHVWAYWGLADAETGERLRIAQDTWGQFPKSTRVKKTTRDSTSVGDKHPAWFVKDILDPKPDEITLLSNADIGFTSFAGIQIREAAEEYGAVHMRRRDFSVTPIESIYSIEDGAEYPGMDACAFTYQWWEKNGYLLPDYVLGRQHWDCGMRNLIRRGGGVELKNMCWHRTHAPQWLSGECNAANLYNEELLCRWIGHHGGSTQDHLYSTQEIKYR
jgi:hypothetical protein